MWCSHKEVQDLSNIQALLADISLLHLPHGIFLTCHKDAPSLMPAGIQVTANAM